MTADSDTSIRFHKLHISVINQIYNKYVFIERLQFYFINIRLKFLFFFVSKWHRVHLNHVV